jgi:hypothetical protein
MLKGRPMQTVRNEAHQVRQAKTRVSVWLWVGVAALLVMTFYAAWDARLLRNEVRQVGAQSFAEMQQRQRLQTQLAILQREKNILTDPASVKIALTPSNPQMPELEATWHSELGIIVSGRRVALPAGDRVLQLWLIPKAPAGKPIPSLTIRPDADGKVFLLVANPPETMEKTKALAITEESSGGSQLPTTPPQWVGGVT